MPISKTQRWLDLIAFLVGRRVPVTVEQLLEGIPAYAEKWVDGTETAQASVRRMFERDKDELRELGIPVETVQFRINYGAEEALAYRLARKDFYLPYLELLRRGEHAAPRQSTLQFTPEELTPLLDGLLRVAEVPSSPLASDARSALRKLSFDLIPSDVPGSVVAFAEPPGADEVRARTEQLSGALLRRKRVRFRYSGIARGQVTERDVAPYGLLFQHGHWYLIGHDALRDAVRVFRVSRMEELAVNQTRANSPDYEIPDDFELAELRNRSAWELGGEDDPETVALVRFAFPRSLWAERNALGELERQEPDGAAVRRFRVRQTGPFVRWLLSLQGEAEVIEPAELAGELRRVAGEVAALYSRET
jgi:proteasome accessory factor B